MLSRLSILDQSPVSTGSTPAEALQNSIDLARHVDTLGYHRFWMSEHHAMETLACTAPEIMLARIGAETSRIRIGSGGIMLPHYSPLKVAETFGTLHALYPNRVDLGIGRAPGGGPIESSALRRERKSAFPDDFPQQLTELLTFLHYPSYDFPESHPFSRITVSPAGPGHPTVWLLGSSLWSAVAAAEYGLPYAFAHFFSGESTREAIETYYNRFTPSPWLAAPKAMAAVGVIAADTQDEADYLHSSVRLLQRRIRQGDRRPIASPDEALRELDAFARSPFPSLPIIENEWPRYFVGTPDKIRHELTVMADALNLDELVVNTITHSHAARLHSYELLAAAFDLQPTAAAPQPTYA